MRRSIFRLLVVCALLGPNSSAALTLDDFEDGTMAAGALNGQVQTASASATGAVGGARKLRVETFTGGTTSDTSAFVEFGLYNHSQDAQTTGESRITWDGGTGLFDPDGLGGIDLTNDGGTEMILDVTSFDYPSNNSITLRLSVYDANDLTGNTSSTAVITLNSVISSSTAISIPFSSFTFNGPAGPAAFTNVGAIVLRIDGSASPAADLTLDWFGTNGNCTGAIPQAGVSAVDECGVCGGDGSTCADCSGEPNGDAVLDRCGVCNGDGQSCLGCDEFDITRTQFRLDGGAKKQEKVIKALTGRLLAIDASAKNRSYVKRVNNKAHKLQIRNWILSWTLPSLINRCENEIFCASSSNSPILDEYRTHSEELRRLTLKVVKRLKKSLGGALGSLESKLQKKGQKLHSENLALADTVPENYSTCS